MKYNVIYNITLYLSAKKHFHIKYERNFYKRLLKKTIYVLTTTAQQIEMPKPLREAF